MNFRTRFEYEPSPRKRFEVSPDSYSRSRLLMVRDMGRELNREYNDAIAISLVGSLVKGKVLTTENAPEADIDLYIFIDLDKIPKYDPYEIRNKIMEMMRGKKEETLLDPDQMAKKDPRWYKFLLPFPIREKGEYSIKNELEQDDFDFDGTDAYTVSGMFGLDIDRRLLRYRQAFLKGLKEDCNPEEQKKFWDRVKMAIVQTRYYDYASQSIKEDQFKKDFPQTFEEAYKRYMYEK